MDINKINKLYDLIRKIIENKEAVIKKYKESNSYFIIKIQSEISVLKKTVVIIDELTKEIQDQNKLKERIYELEKELWTTNKTNELLIEKFVPIEESSVQRPTINSLKQWKQKRMPSTNN